MLPAPMRKLQQANLDSVQNALANAATRLVRFQMIYGERYPNMAELAKQIEDKIKGAFLQAKALRDCL